MAFLQKVPVSAYWELDEPKGPKGSIAPIERRTSSSVRLWWEFKEPEGPRGPNSSVRLCWELEQPEGPKRSVFDETSRETDDNWTTEGPSWGISGTFLEPLVRFCHLLAEKCPGFLKDLWKLTFEYPPEGPGLDARIQQQFSQQPSGFQQSQLALAISLHPRPGFNSSRSLVCALTSHTCDTR